MPTVLKPHFNELLRYLAEWLDISEYHYRQAEERYQSLGNWLGRDKSIVAKFAPRIYPQGSFRFGTIIKPVSNEEHYDIDLVCELAISKDQISQKELKEAVGYEIKGYARANNMNSPCKEGRRCWTLNYAEGAQFHMDSLPALPDGESFRLLLYSNGFSADRYTDRSIAITDNTSPNYAIIYPFWPQSNPIGYAEWFKDRMKVQFEASRMSLAERLRADVEEVPEYKVKTPLQRAIQILKRHRDIRFIKEPEKKPISIIITTLAARAYENEVNVLDALINILERMPNFILRQDGVVWIPNPVNPLENFADRWREQPEREEIFMSWLDQVRADLQLGLQQRSIPDAGEALKSSFSDRPVNEALQYFPHVTKRASRLDVPNPQAASRFNVAHRGEPPWLVRPEHSVTVSGYIKLDGQWRGFNSNSRPLPKECSLKFSARTTAQPPYDVYWQVVNTGLEAEQKGQLRGQIFRSKTAGVGGLTQVESTAFTGLHWVECFIVKNGVCIAKSGEFVVNIN